MVKTSKPEKWKYIWINNKHMNWMIQRAESMLSLLSVDKQIYELYSGDL